MAIINMEDIKKYLKDNPPGYKAFEILDHKKNEALGKSGLLGFTGYVTKKEERLDIEGRISEIIPDTGEISLSDFDTTFFLFDKDGGIFFKAKYDISDGRVYPINTAQVKLNGLKESSELSVRFFLDEEGKHGKGKSATASFINKLIEISDVPSIQIGNHLGDTCNRYFSYQKYNRI